MWNRQGEPILLDQCWSSLKEAPRRPPWDFSKKCRKKNFLDFLDKNKSKVETKFDVWKQTHPSHFTREKNDCHEKAQPMICTHGWLEEAEINRSCLLIFFSILISASLIVEIDFTFHFSFSFILLTVVLCSQGCGQASVLRRRRRSCLLYLLICSLIDTCNLTSLSYEPN